MNAARLFASLLRAIDGGIAIRNRVRPSTSPFRVQPASTELVSRDSGEYCSLFFSSAIAPVACADTTRPSRYAVRSAPSSVMDDQDPGALEWPAILTLYRGFRTPIGHPEKSLLLQELHRLACQQ